MSQAPTHDLQHALAHSSLVYERAELERAIARMAGEIARDYAGQRPLCITIMNGGLYFSALLLLQLGIDVEFDYLHATRYRGQTSGGEALAWLRRPHTDLRGKPVLLFDDILDEGPTLDEVKRWCLEQGAAEVRLAVLAWKRHGRGVTVTPEYWGLEVPDKYVFGFGMDYYEQGRNLPAIYALEDGQ